MPESNSDLYADLYGEEEDDNENEPVKPTDDIGGNRPAAASTSSSPALTQPQSSSSIQVAQGRPPPGSYASQVAQQFSSYQKQQPVDPSEPPSPVEPVNSTSPSQPTAIPVVQYAAQTQNGGPVRPSEMKDEGKMFIGGLNWDTTDESLREYMSQFGPVDACTIMRDPTGRSRGFAFLTYEQDQSVDACIAHSEHVLDGKLIDPKRAVPRQDYLRHQRVFVGGLPPTVTSASLRSHFQQYGEVVDCMVMLDRETNRSKGFGFVTYNDASGVEAALAMGQIELDGKVIEVKEATPRGAQHRANNRTQQEALGSQTPQVTNQNSGGGWNAAQANMMNVNPGQMAQLYSRMMQMNGMGMGMGMGGMGMGGMGGMGGIGMMNPMMMMNGFGMGMGGGMGGGMNMAPMNPMNGMMGSAGGVGGTRAVSPPSGVTAARTVQRGPVAGTGPSRLVNRGANNFHPYAR